MIQFEDGQFEIAIATYKRPEFIEAWLEKCFKECVVRNIALSIYDSSPDKLTENAVKTFNKRNEISVAYYHVNPNTIIGYKPMIPLLESKSEYLWVSGDSRYHDFDELDKKVFPHIKNGTFDYICFNITNNYRLPDTVYDDKGKMLHDVFVASTCIGLSIYRTAIFNPIKENKELLRNYDVLFKNNFGFGWLGYFYNVYALGEYKALLVNVKILLVLNKKKTQSWAVRFYGCWVEDLCHIIDNIPACYKGKESVPKNTWTVMHLEAIPYCYSARKYGDLDKEKFYELEQNGYICRITDNPKMIKRFATAPLIEIECINILYKLYNLATRAIKKL